MFHVFVCMYVVWNTVGVLSFFVRRLCTAINRNPIFPHQIPAHTACTDPKGHMAQAPRDYS